MSFGATTSRNVGLDACRALAIALVVFCHGAGFLEPLMPETIASFARVGFIGVELFFVLSGFLIGQMLLRSAGESQKGWFRTFYLRRLFRTLPSYLLFLGLNIVLGALLMRPPMPDDAWRYLVFIQNATTSHPMFFPEAWSLAIEELFYVGFPLSYLVVSSLLGINRKNAILVTALAVIVASVLARGVLVSDTASWDEDVRKVAVFRFDGLMVGVLVAWLHQSHAWLLKKKAMLGLLTALLVVCGIYVSLLPTDAINASYFGRTFLFTFTSFGCAGLVIAALELRLYSGLEWVVTQLARISYSAYLVNLPVLIVINQFVVNDGIAGAAWFLVFHLATFSLAAVLYHYYELVFYRIRDQLVPAQVPSDHMQLRLAA